MKKGCPAIFIYLFKKCDHSHVLSCLLKQFSSTVTSPFHVKKVNVFKNERNCVYSVKYMISYMYNFIQWTLWSVVCIPERLLYLILFDPRRVCYQWLKSIKANKKRIIPKQEKHFYLFLGIRRSRATGTWTKGEQLRKKKQASTLSPNLRQKTKRIANSSSSHMLDQKRQSLS